MAGPATALRIAELGGAPPTLIVEGGLPSGSFDPDRRTQVPLTERRFMKSLGVDTSGMVPIDGVALTMGERRLPGVTWLAARVGGYRDMVAPDTAAARDELVNKALDAGVHVIEGKVSDVEIGDGPWPRVGGVYVGRGEERQLVLGSMVVDATGSTAFVADKVAEQVPGAIHVVERDVPTTYMGGYVRLDGLSDTGPLRGAGRLGLIGILRTGLRTMIAPHQTEGSDATHMLLVSGPDADVDASRGDVEEFKADLAELYGEGSVWHTEVAEHVVSVDRRNSYKFKVARTRVPVGVAGLVLVGDSSAHTNPAAGHGLKNMAEGVGSLTKAVAGTSSHRQAVRHFNDTRPEVVERQLRETSAIARGFDRAGEFMKNRAARRSAA